MTSQLLTIWVKTVLEDCGVGTCCAVYLLNMVAAVALPGKHPRSLTEKTWSWRSLAHYNAILPVDLKEMTVVDRDSQEG